MQKLTEKLGEFIGVEPLFEGKEYDVAKTMFDKGVMPDGEKWPRGKPDIFVGFDGDVIIKKVLKKDGKKSTTFTFEMELKPGHGGGGGATIEAAMSNHFFNLTGTGPKSIKGMKSAFESAVKSDTKGLGKHIHKWLSKPDNWVWRIVGWGDRNKWSKPSTKIVRIGSSGAMIDPTRRKWPSGRTEVWVPLEVTIQAEMKRR